MKDFFQVIGFNALAEGQEFDVGVFETFREACEAQEEFTQGMETRDVDIFQWRAPDLETLKRQLKDGRFCGAFFVKQH